MWCFFHSEHISTPITKPGEAKHLQQAFMRNHGKKPSFERSEISHLEMRSSSWKCEKYWFWHCYSDQFQFCLRFVKWAMQYIHIYIYSSNWKINKIKHFHSINIKVDTTWPGLFWWTILWNNVLAKKKHFSMEKKTNPQTTHQPSQHFMSSKVPQISLKSVISNEGITLSHHLTDN